MPDPKTPRENTARSAAIRRWAAISGPLMFVVVVVAVIFAMSVFFRISDIQVEGNVHYTDQEIIRAIDIEEGDNLFFFDRFAAIGRAFSKLPYIETVTVERSLPNKVIITVEESTALAYLELGDEKWTLDHSCKVLGKALEAEAQFLIPVVGIRPGSLMIGEQMLTEDEDTETVEYLAEILDQIQARGMDTQVDRVDFSNPNSPEISYGGKYTLVLGRHTSTEYKFGMLVSAMEQLKEGDVGILDVSDGAKAHFTPN